MLMVVKSFGFKSPLDVGTDHDSGDAASATCRDGSTTATVGVEVALVKNNEQKPVTARLKLWKRQDFRNLLRQPLVGLRKRSGVRVVLQVRDRKSTRLNPSH